MPNLCNFNYADLLERNAILYRNAPALIGDFGVVNHDTLFAHSRALASSLQRLGVTKGERVALLASNNPRTLELLGAVAMCGAILVLLNTRSSASEITEIVRNSDARGIFVDAALKDLVSGLAVELNLYVFAGEATGRLQAVPEPGDLAIFAPPDVSADSPLIGIPTAAVQGRPRIAILSHAALMQQAMQLTTCWSLTARDRHLCILPLFHMAGLTLSVAAQLVGGASVIVGNSDAGAAVDAVERYHASFFASFAPILSNVLDAADTHPNPTALVSLRIVTGLEPRPVVERLLQSYPQVDFWSGYGQTETGGIVTLARSSDHPGSVGRPLPQVALRIATERGAVRESGEILVRSPGVFSGYWQLPDVNANVARDGWHHTGDLGRLDTDGYLWYEGRVPEKALIKSGGENIYPAEVEQALLAHPAVAEARVVGVPDAKWGEAVRALCVLQKDAQVDQLELIEFVGRRIARFKRPREVIFVDSLNS